MISIIFSVYNEETNLFFKNSLKKFSTNKNIELIVIDGGSTDNTLEISKKYNTKIFILKKSNRALRYNLGLKNAKNNLIIFNHPRSTLKYNVINKLLKIENKNKKNNLFWGGFTHKFDNNNILYKFTSWYSNNIRAKIFKIIYLDHCIYGSKKIFNKVKGFDNMEIFEETTLCKKLNKIKKPIIINSISYTSSIRFKKNGFFKQSFMNMTLKAAYYTGTSDKYMNKFYEKKLKLNQKV